MGRQKRFRLSKLDLDEISQVMSGDDPTADILIIKNDPVEKMTGPSGDSMHVDRPLSSDFKMKDKMKRRKKPTRKMREEAMRKLEEMADMKAEDEKVKKTRPARVR